MNADRWFGIALALLGLALVVLAVGVAGSLIVNGGC